MIVNEITVKDIMTKSKLPASDYAVNPYVGCPHRCKYCYACFMKRFTKHDEEWGEFIDVKNFPTIKNPQKYNGKSVFIGSVTDGYNPFEKKYKKTREILKQFINTDAEIIISTKSKLVTRDLDLLKQLKNVTVAFSINTMDKQFRSDMDRASTIQERIEAMKILHDGGIHTVTFISPIFPCITDVYEIIENTHDYCDEFWLENLNLRGSYKGEILHYIKDNYPQYYNTYYDIYINKNMQYWIDISKKLEEYAETNNVNIINYFYHELIKKK